MSKKNKNSKETSAQDQAKENFDNSNVFIMTRPDEGQGTISIQSEDDSNKSDDIHDLYSASFFDFVMNLSGVLTTKENELALKLVTPTLAYQYFLEDPEQAQSIINSFAQANKKEKDFLTKFVDPISTLEFILKLNFKNFNVDYQKVGLEKSLQKHHQFYADMEEIFFSLPACYCFNLIDFCERMIKNRKKKK